MSTRDKITGAALALFDTEGFEKTSVASICRNAGIANGSFFHAFPTKDALAGDIYMSLVGEYHASMVAGLVPGLDAAQGIAALIGNHLDWVVAQRSKARFLFEQARAEWLAPIRERQADENARFAEQIEIWRAPLIDDGALLDMPSVIFTAQLIGPAQILCRAWLSGRSDVLPTQSLPLLISCAQRALLREP